MDSSMLTRASSSLRSGVISTFPSRVSRWVERFSSTSMAPLVKRVGTPSMSWRVLISLRSESKANSPRRGCWAR